MTKFATAAFRGTYNKEENLKNILRLIDEAADNKADLIIFPESALSGYLMELHRIHTLAEDGIDEYWYQYKNAETVEGPAVGMICEKARERNIYVVCGFTRKDLTFDYKLYDSCLVAGPEGLLGTYDKVHLAIDEIHMFYPGKEFPIFETRFGRIGIMICYDKNFPEPAREMVLQGADILICCTCWGYNDSDFDGADPMQDLNYRNYDLLDRVRAIENQRYWISSNWFGKVHRMNLFGAANIINPEGNTVATTGTKEGIAYYETESVKEDIYRGQYYNFGLSYYKDRRPSAYKHLLQDITVNNGSEEVAYD